MSNEKTCDCSGRCREGGRARLERAGAGGVCWGQGLKRCAAFVLIELRVVAEVELCQVGEALQQGGRMFRAGVAAKILPH